jgi:hypothetical protein
MTKAEQTKTEVDKIKKQLKKSKRWRYRALMVIYWLQTDVEKMAEKTIDNNSVGFTKADGHTLAPIAKHMIAQLNKRSPNAPIDARIRFLIKPKEDAMLFNKITKYAHQLLKLSKGEITPPPETTNIRYKL